MDSILMVVHIIVAIALVSLVLLQQGKGADMGAAFGSGSSGTVFGASGSSNFLSRMTAILATTFFVTSLTLAYFAVDTAEPESVLESAPATQVMPESDLPDMPMDVPKQGNSDLPPE